MSAPLDALTAPLEPLGDGAWLVGGGLRDALLHRHVAEVDLAVEGDGRAAARVLAEAHGAGRFELSRGFDSWRVHGGRLPYAVDITPLQGPDLAEDLGRRDFTVNALAVAVTGHDRAVVDLHGGLDDLAARRLRLVRPTAFAADPVRLLRAGRLAAQLGFEIDPATVARARSDAGGLWDAPGERIAEELRRALRLPGAVDALLRVDQIGALGVLAPELEEARGLEQNPYHHRDVLGHTMEVVAGVASIAGDPEPVFRGAAGPIAERLAEPLADDLTRGQALLLAALLHDMAKPATRAVQPGGRVTFMGHDRLGAEMADRLLLRLRASRRLREFVTHCVRYHLPLGFLVHRQPLSLRQIDRYLRLTAPAEIELIVLSAADRMATRGPRTRDAAVQRHLDLARLVLRTHLEIQAREPIRPPVGGDVLARELDRRPGPWLGELLIGLREEQLVGRVRSTDDALRFARAWDADPANQPGGDASA